MTASEPSRLAPRLRFPEFRSQGGWPLTTLGEVLEEHGLKSDGTSEVHSVSLAKGIVPQVEHLGRSFAASDTAHYSLVRPSDVVYTRSPLAEFKLGIVKQHRRDHNAIVSPLYGVFAPKSRDLGLIVEAFFESPTRAFRYLDPLAQKGAKNTIQLSNERFLSGSIYLPDDEDEQKKIADCLGSLDDLIAAEGRKLEAMRQHKRGLMQQLFPQPGETRPRLRFPKFKGAREWTPHKIGDFVVKSFYGTSAATAETGQYPVLRMGNMRDGRLDLTSLAFIDLDAESFESFRLQRGDILLNRTNSRELVGKISVFDHDLECITASYIVAFRLDSDRIDPWFCNVMLNTPMHQHRIRLLSTPSIGQANINPTAFRVGLDIVIPKLAEQQQVAAAFSALDDALAAQSRRVAALKSHKQGLLLKLFPSLKDEAQ